MEKYQDIYLRSSASYILLVLRSIAGSYVKYLRPDSSSLLSAWLIPTVPGPTLAAITGLLRGYYVLNGHEVKWIHEMHKRYGEVVRLGPNRLSYITPHAWRDIAGPAIPNKRVENSKDPHFGNPDLHGYRPFTAELVSATHKQRRSVYAPAFSEKALKQQEPLILHYVEMLTQIVKRNAETNTRINIVKLFNFTTFDIMAELAFGEPLGLLGQSDYSPRLKAVFASMKITTIIRVALDYGPLGFLFKVATPKSIKDLAHIHYNHTYDRVVKRIARVTDGKPDIWKLLLENDKGVHLSDRQMTADAGTFMIAGTETTATLSSALLYLLLKHPEEMERLKAELRVLSKEDLILEKLGQLTFLNACISEALRVYPPAPIGFPRRVPKGGNVICKEWIPEDTRVAFAHYAAYHSSLNFKDPDSFIPDRWLPGSVYNSDRKEAFAPFSTGPRNCIGQNFANHEVRIILAYMIWHFDFELCPESADWMTDQKVYLIWEKPDLYIKAKYIR